MRRILQTELRRIRSSTEGNRNENLNKAAFAIGRYVDAASLNLEAAAGRLLDAALKTGLPRREAAQTIRAALDAGMEEMPPIVFRTPGDIIEDASTATTPQQVIELRREFAHTLASADSTTRDAWADAAKDAGLGGKTTLAKAMKESRPTDADVRDAFMEQHPNLIYHPALEWMEYVKGSYTAVPDHLVKKWIMEVIDEADRPTLTAARVESVAKLLFFGTCRELALWDQRDVIVCQNGTLDLDPSRAPKLRRHRRDDYSTHTVDYAYPKGHFAEYCPNFLKAVSRLPDEVQSFLQEYVGYCLTKDTRHDVMVWIIGRPGSGKSTLVRGILTALGNHATMVSLRELNRSRFALNAIVGKTLIYGTDVGTDFADNTDTLNSLVSGDPIRVESKYSNPIEINPTAKVLWAMTKKPALKDPDDGLFRRVQLLTVPPLPAEEADPNVRVLVEQEGAGILKWAIQGLLRLRKRGHFLVPKAVKAHTVQYRDDQDKTAHFVRDCLWEIPAPLRSNAAPGERTDDVAELMEAAIQSAKVPAKPQRAAVLYRAYVAWCKISGYNALGKYKFYDELRRLGLDLGHHGANVLVCFSHAVVSQEEWDTEAVRLTLTDNKGKPIVSQVL
jgi:putative DNA primase/helicase